MTPSASDSKSTSQKNGTMVSVQSRLTLFPSWLEVLTFVRAMATSSWHSAASIARLAIICLCGQVAATDRASCTSSEPLSKTFLVEKVLARSHHEDLSASRQRCAADRAGLLRAGQLEQQWKLC